MVVINHATEAKENNMDKPIFSPEKWKAVDGFDLQDITYHRSIDSGVVRVASEEQIHRAAHR